MSSSNNTQLLNIVLGNPFDLMREQKEPNAITPYLEPFKKRGFNQIDTANAYQLGEENFGKVDLTKEGFVVDTKVKSFAPGAHKADVIKESIKNSYNKLHVPKIHVLYLHAPDRATPFAESLRALNDEYVDGKFEKLGLSNYTADEVREILRLCDENKWVRPTVYQGNYSVVVRSGEADLFPLLKKEKISFYAWSPLAGGVLTGKVKREEHSQSSHFTGAVGDIFKNLFFRDSVFDAVEKMEVYGKKNNFTLVELSLRWLAFHSQLSKSDGDAIILGATRPSQFEDSIKDMEKGPLPKDAADFVSSLWDNLKADPISYHY